VILAANVSSLARVRRRAKPALVLLASALAGAILMSCGGSSTPNRLVIYEGKAAVTEAGLEYSNVTDVRDATNVYAIDAKSGKTTQLTHGESFDGHPGWAPDYKHILFSSDRNDMPGQQDIYIMDADGSNPRALTSTRGVSEWTPKFSPDASQIVFVQVNKPGGSYLMLMDPDGGNQRRVAGPYVFASSPHGAATARRSSSPPSPRARTTSTSTATTSPAARCAPRSRRRRPTSARTSHAMASR
jgi:dipeptidyl aminopeptidase/acylaminoacyl peptidase